MHYTDLRQDDDCMVASQHRLTAEINDQAKVNRLVSLKHPDETRHYTQTEARDTVIGPAYTLNIHAAVLLHFSGQETDLVT